MAASPTARAAVLKWARELVEGNMVYHFYTEAPEETLPLYGLGWIPEGFEETDVFNNGVAYKAIYTNAETGKGFVFEYYYMDDGAVPMVIPEDDINLEKTKINGTPADFYQAPNDEDTNGLFIFDEENNICFTVLSTLDRDTMFCSAVRCGWRARRSSRKIKISKNNVPISPSPSFTWLRVN